jgi:hypothetical protein
MVGQVINTLALLEGQNIDRVPVVTMGAGSVYFNPAGHQGRRTVWEYYFEPVVPGWSEDRVLDVLGDRAIELLESKRRQIEHQRSAVDSPRDPPGMVVPMTEIDWRNVADLDALIGQADWLFTESFKPLVDGHRQPGPGLRSSRSDLFKRYVRPRDYIRLKAEAFFDSRLRGHHVVGVHVRGSDWRTLDQIPFAEFFATVEARLATVGGGTSCRIFLATDEAQVVEVFAQRFGDRLICYDAVRRAIDEERGGAGPTRGPVPGYVAKSREVARQNGEDAVVECLILGKSDLLIHNGSGLAFTATLLGAEAIVLNNL